MWTAITGPSVKPILFISRRGGISRCHPGRDLDQRFRGARSLFNVAWFSCFSPIASCHGEPLNLCSCLLLWLWQSILSTSDGVSILQATINEDLSTRREMDGIPRHCTTLCLKVYYATANRVLLTASWVRDVLSSLPSDRSTSYRVNFSHHIRPYCGISAMYNLRQLMLLPPKFSPDKCKGSVRVTIEVVVNNDWFCS